MNDGGVVKGRSEFFQIFNRFASPTRPLMMSVQMKNGQFSQINANVLDVDNAWFENSTKVFHLWKSSSILLMQHILIKSFWMAEWANTFKAYFC